MTPMQALCEQMHQELAVELSKFVESRLLPELWSRFGDDVVQESFQRLFSGWVKQGFDDDHPPRVVKPFAQVRPILFGILQNVMREMIRASKRHDHGCEGLEAVADDNDSHADEDQNRLETAKTLCSEVEWSIFEMMANENLGSDEIGRRLGMTPGRVRTRVHRTRKRLREAANRDFI